MATKRIGEAPSMFDIFSVENLKANTPYHWWVSKKGNVTTKVDGKFFTVFPVHRKFWRGNTGPCIYYGVGGKAYPNNVRELVALIERNV